jgi:hypothetical protein
MGICESICAKKQYHSPIPFASVTKPVEQEFLKIDRPLGEDIECIICLEEIEYGASFCQTCLVNNCKITSHEGCIHYWHVQKRKCPICDAIWEKEPPLTRNIKDQSHYSSENIDIPTPNRYRSCSEDCKHQSALVIPLFDRYYISI